MPSHSQVRATLQSVERSHSSTDCATPRSVRRTFSTRFSMLIRVLGHDVPVLTADLVVDSIAASLTFLTWTWWEDVRITKLLNAYRGVRCRKDSCSRLVVH